MEITIKRKISKDVLENIFTTALEGGSNYWYYITDEQVQKVRQAVPKSTTPYLCLAILEAVLEHNVEVEINDSEDEDEVLGVITRDTLIERIELLANSSDAWALENELKEDGDASSSDVVFQYIVLGEVVYG
jgi:predicted  nucleic acid-binding Zn-ribbon protein